MRTIRPDLAEQYLILVENIGLEFRDDGEPFISYLLAMSAEAIRVQIRQSKSAEGNVVDITTRLNVS